MFQAIRTYMTNLDIVCVPGSVPVWWPPELDYNEYAGFNKEGKLSHVIHRSVLTSLHLGGLISVASHLLLHHRSRLREDIQASKPWTARFRRQNIPNHKSQVDLAHPQRILTKEESSDSSITPPRSVVADEQAIHDAIPSGVSTPSLLPASASLDSV